MSLVFGPVRQIGYVTHDMDAALRFFVERLRIGPWFVARGMRVPEFRYRGAPSPLVMDVALANSGPLQIELIQQTNDAPSVYRDWLARHPRDDLVQHLSWWVEDYPAALAHAAAEGFETVQDGVSGYGPFVYVQRPADPSVVVELTAYTPQRRSVFAQVAAAAAEWDGSEPVRTGWPRP